MKRKTKYAIAIVSVPLILICAAFGWYYYMASRFADLIYNPHKLSEISVEKFNQIKTGDSKEQVIALIGEHASKSGPVRVSSVEESRTPKKNESCDEYWQYSYTSGLFQDPHPKAFVVHFDCNGKVISTKRPDK